MNKDLPSQIQSVVFKYPIWGLLYAKERNSIIIDCRDENKKEIVIHELIVKSLKTKRHKLAISWLEKLVEAEGDLIYSIEYQDIKDPSSYQFKSTSLTTMVSEKVDDLPVFTKSIMGPSLFEIGSSHHQTVTNFLSIELPLSCEYLEQGDNIILSYYLRSDEGFDRYLLLIEDGKRKWKVLQDRQMKGFSSGAFFVVDSQVIFVRDRNEVCIYNL